VVTPTGLDQFHSPDGTRIVSGSIDKTMRVWDALSGNEVISPLHGHKGSVQSVAFSPDGTRIVSGSSDRTVRVWDTVSGNEIIPPLRGHDNWVQSVAFSPDGTLIVSSDDKTMLVWNATTGLPYVSSGAHGNSGLNNFIPSMITIKRDGWIVDLSDNRTISKLPEAIPHRCSATSGKSLAIGTALGQILVLDFPPAAFSSPETRPAEAKREP